MRRGCGRGFWNCFTQRDAAFVGRSARKTCAVYVPKKLYMSGNRAVKNAGSQSGMRSRSTVMIAKDSIFTMNRGEVSGCIRTR